MSFRHVLLAGTLVLGCAPELDQHLWRCGEHVDCGSGFLCDSTKGHCVAALDDEDGVFSDRLVLGMSAALGDDVSLGLLGRTARTGIEAAFHHANRTGGVYGRQLELVAADDSYNPAKTITNVKQLIGGADRQVFALTGVIGTAPSLAARDLAIKEKVLFFGPATGFDGLEPDPPDRYIFNLRPRYSEEAAQLTAYLLLRNKPLVPSANVAVFAQGDDDNGTLDSFGKSAFSGVVKALANVKVAESQVKVATYASTDTEEVSKATDALLHWMADPARKPASDNKLHVGIIVVALHDAAAQYIRATQIGLNAATTGGPVIADGAFTAQEISRLKDVVPHFVTLSTVGEGLVPMLASFGTYKDGAGQPRHYGEGTIIALPVPHPESNASGVISYREHLATYAPKERPGFISLEAYLAGRLLVEGLRRHGPDITTESLVDTLESLRVDLGIGTPLGFSASSHQAFNKLWGARLDSKLDLSAIGLLLE